LKSEWYIFLTQLETKSDENPIFHLMPIVDFGIEYESKHQN